MVPGAAGELIERSLRRPDLDELAARTDARMAELLEVLPDAARTELPALLTVVGREE